MGNNFKWIFVLIIVLVCHTCKKSDDAAAPLATDTTKPVINLVDPTINKTYKTGSSLHLKMDLSDNMELKFYKVSITKGLKGLEKSDWGYTNTWIIAPGMKTVRIDHNEIIIPTTVLGKPVTTGNYDLVVTCVDLAGNEIRSSLTIIINE